MAKIFSLVFWLGAALVVAALGVRFLMPAQNQYAIYLAWGGLGCMLVYTLTQWREIAQMFSGRQARYGTLSMVSILIVLGILTAINYIGTQQKKRWDLTENQQFSLSDQSRNVLAKLDAPLQIRVFAKDLDFQRYRDRLNEYEYVSDQISTDYIDPDKDQAAAKQYEVQQYGTIVVSYAERTERTTMETEQDITNTIIKVVTGEQKKVLFTVGHGERDIASTDRDGYGAVVEALKRENYMVEPFPLAQTGSVPADASVVVVAGPRNDLLEGEVTALSDFLNKGGKLLLMIDPPERVDAPPLANVIGLARTWGAEVGLDVVVDASGMGRLFGTSEAMPLALKYPTHPITDRFSSMTMFPFSRSVTVMAPPPEGKIVQPLAETGEASWAETDLKGLFASQEVGQDEKTDRMGPITIAVSTTAPVNAPAPEADANAPRPETRVVVFGDSDFPATAYLGFQGNRDLFMNTIGWLAQQENLISIRPKEASDRRITLTSAQQTNLIWLSLLIVPGLVFGAGVVQLVAEAVMRGLKSTIALFLVLVGLGAYIYFVSWKEPEVSTENRVFAGLEAADIQELVVTPATGEATTLRKEGDAWQIVAPITTAAASAEATAMTGALSQMDTVRVVDEQPTDLAGFGLAPPRVSVQFTSKDSKPSGRLLIGERSPTGAGVYAKRDDQPRVFLIAEFQGSSFDKSTFDLRDKAVVTFDRSQVNGVEVERAGQKMTFARKDNDWAMTAPVSADADFGTVESVVTQMQNLQMRSVAAEQPTPEELKKFGLERPSATVTLGMGSARATLAVGGAASDATVYVKDLSRPLVVTVDNTLVEELKKEADDYRSRDLFAFRAFNATNVEVTRGGQTVVFERVKGAESAQDTWRRVSPAAGDVERAKMDELLSGLADVRATAFRPSTAGTGLDSPVMTLVVKFEDGKREDRASFGRSGAGTFASLPNQPGAAVIDAEQLDEALKTLDEISK